MLVSPGPGNVDLVGTTNIQKEKKEILAPIGEEEQELPGDDHGMGRRRQSRDQRWHGAAHGDVEPPMEKGNVEKDGSNGLGSEVAAEMDIEEAEGEEGRNTRSHYSL